MVTRLIPIIILLFIIFSGPGGLGWGGLAPGREIKLLGGEKITLFGSEEDTSLWVLKVSIRYFACIIYK